MLIFSQAVGNVFLFEFTSLSTTEPINYLVFNDRGRIVLYVWPKFFAHSNYLFWKTTLRGHALGIIYVPLSHGRGLWYNFWFRNNFPIVLLTVIVSRPHFYHFGMRWLVYCVTSLLTGYIRIECGYVIDYKFNKSRLIEWQCGIWAKFK
jgi:hypothetical protein